MVKVDLLIFDLDGTLADTGRDIADAINFTLRALGLEMLDQRRILGFVGDGVQTLVERCLGPDNQSLFVDAMAIFLEYYSSHLLDSTILYPGVRNCLDYFKNKKKVVISNKRHDFTVRIVNGLGIAHYFDDIVGGDFWPYKKPDWRLVDHYLVKHKIMSSMAVVIGDGVNDVLLAKAAGIRSCAFLNGLTEREKLLALQPDYTYEDLSELNEIFT